MRRGEVWWADLPAPVGAEPGFRRPVLIVQSDEFNASRIGTVMAVVVTSNLALANAPGNVNLPRGVSRLPKESVANVSQVITIDRTRLAERVSTLPAAVMEEIDEGLRLALWL
jgi:mRNA interferase MazF